MIRIVVVRGLAPRGVEIQLEPGVARHGRSEPPARAVIARPAVREPEAQVRRAREPSAEQRQPVARLGTEAPRRPLGRWAIISSLNVKGIIMTLPRTIPDTIIIYA